MARKSKSKCPCVKRVRITVRFSSGTKEDGAACHMAGRRRPFLAKGELPCHS
ncbi:hypothetical protein PAHAL_1G100700 [Panicum hallii]|uniref:Uncharacterized protein n=1 Tax=Panicum hallii TaxID=206008 RepID=A0A2T8KUP8_9POAL|nr:hypothetical protein PAHAL_1G100700 [Panicum hallii]